MERIVFEHKKNCVNVYGQGLDITNYRIWVRVGKIKFYSKQNKYFFVPRFLLQSVDAEMMQKIVDKIQQLYKKNKAKIDANEVKVE